MSVDPVSNLLSQQRDRGERYAVRFSTDKGKRRTYGYTNDLGRARAWIMRIQANPKWSKPRLVDRA